MSKILLDSQPLVVIPELAAEIGLNEAIILQQINYWVLKNKAKNSNLRDGYYWTYNSYVEWEKNFPFWSNSTIVRAIKKLETKKLLITSDKYNLVASDRTKWYRIDYKVLDDIFKNTENVLGLTIPLSQNDKANLSDCQSQFVKLTSSSNTETSSETSSKHTKHTGHMDNYGNKLNDELKVAENNSPIAYSVSTTDNASHLENSIILPQKSKEGADDNEIQLKRPPMFVGDDALFSYLMKHTTLDVIENSLELLDIIPNRMSLKEGSKLRNFYLGYIDCVKAYTHNDIMKALDMYLKQLEEGTNKLMCPTSFVSVDIIENIINRGYPKPATKKKSSSEKSLKIYADKLGIGEELLREELKGINKAYPFTKMTNSDMTSEFLDSYVEAREKYSLNDLLDSFKNVEKAGGKYPYKLNNFIIKGVYNMYLGEQWKAKNTHKLFQKDTDHSSVPNNREVKVDYYEF
ncbi:hypothetical protein SAMN05446037_100696 [Anaerovirgula multivorans]|uniref:Uncharacterized protein n=1 Tax=Anaerovirgula multivorans TaxID=312168 RepID=A0A239CSI5_9FIRM|nr:hypothetical protein [Anaerovirgula multivorans]SNS22343.1 hypothetical protein SAMN05446037_100696 [Anaerovirgula multivorans]